MGRRDSQTAHRLLADGPGTPARFGFGTAHTITDFQGDTLVLPDGIPEVAAGVATEEETEGVQIAPDPSQPNQPLPMLTVCGPVAVGERVAWVSLPSGPSMILGSVGAQPRLIGAALVAGGRADQTVASATDTAVTGLSCEVEVTHPDHLIEVHVSLSVTNSSGSAQSLVGRVYRAEETDECATLAAVEVGRYFRHSALGAGATIGVSRPVVDVVDPGTYTYTANMQSAIAAGFVIVTNPASTTPSFAASMLVYDCGPLPEGYALT